MLSALVGCAFLERPKSLSGADIVALAREGKSPRDIIQELQRTYTVLPLQASDIVALHESGVPNEVLDYLQRAQIDEMRARDRSLYQPWDRGYRGFGPCPWPPRVYRGAWGC
jgi:hypothetical protein